jgi:hypothetical protein
MTKNANQRLKVGGEAAVLSLKNLAAFDFCRRA